MPPPLDVQAIAPPDESAEEREGLVFLGIVLLYGQLVGFGYWVASGIVEEKTSRVVEVLLAKAGPRDLVTGKILGIGALGFVQLVGFVALGLGGGVGGRDRRSPARRRCGWRPRCCCGSCPASPSTAPCSAWGARSPAGPRTCRHTTGPAMIMTIASFFAAIAAVGDPGGTLARITTFLPPTAPLVLPIRSAAGELAAWEAVVSLGLVLVSIVVVLNLAARVYAGAALHVRGPLKLRQALARRA